MVSNRRTYVNVVCTVKLTVFQDSLFVFVQGTGERVNLRSRNVNKAVMVE